MMHFEYRSRIAAPVERVFAFHEQPDAFEQLVPPWQRVEVISKQGGLEAGAIVKVRIWLGPFYRTCVAHHIAYRRNEYFVDELREGPFSAWVHMHRFEAVSESTDLVDSIEFALPGGLLAEKVAGWFVRRQLNRMFEYRHQVTKRACEAA